MIILQLGRPKTKQAGVPQNMGFRNVQIQRSAVPPPVSNNNNNSSLEF